ncbi:MAG: class I SAM-dependent methyltransferase [Deltaproteobacteria bacterium]|nr:class I SAM-dependent methyltransferase [Deltaproteobacteria bacterium]
MVKADPDWWKTLFDEIYLITDARSVCDEQLTCREVDFLVQTLNLDKPWPILDLCGGHGRHSLELSRRGFNDVTVLEYSKVLINLGIERAQKEGLNTTKVVKDARTNKGQSKMLRIIIISGSTM